MRHAITRESNHNKPLCSIGHLGPFLGMLSAQSLTCTSLDAGEHSVPACHTVSTAGGATFVSIAGHVCLSQEGAYCILPPAPPLRKHRLI